ncbi:MAG TPA: SpoIIE family protein phosphatase [Bacteroidales bacterium]|nr:SpoIIE family protein phosphatase [Bacteroidales bacterium]
MFTIKKFIIYIVLLGFIFTQSYAQQIPEDIKDELSGYQNHISKYQKEGNQPLELEYLNKAAFLCWNNQLLSEAIHYFEQAVEINHTLDNKNGLLLGYNYLGMLYGEKNQHQNALDCFEKSLNISRQIKNKSSIASALINIAQTQQLLSNYNESNKTAFYGVEIAKEINELKYVRSFYGIIAENYKELGNSAKSIEYFDLFASIDKYLKNQEITSIKQKSSEEVNKAQAEKNKTQQELVKQSDKLKETEDSLAEIEAITREQKMLLELKELKISEQRAQLKLERLVKNFFIWGFVVILIFLLFFIVFYRKIRVQKNHIQQQRDTLDLQNKKINSSIQYAKNIQRAILPVEKELNKIFDYFIIYRPKDIVSGDFYWYAEINSTIYIAVIDCTGHGVPGAFMSMIGNRLFNEIVLVNRINDPAKILTILNVKIIEALKQKESDNSDGMDVCLVSINTKKGHKKIVFSGAKRPLLIYKNQKNKLIEVKGDRHSIGGVKNNEQAKQFTSHEIDIELNDILYLSSDGLIDQNNEARKRFGSSKLKQLITKNASHSLAKQKEIIEKELDNFQGNVEQRDDITLLGLKIIL